MEKFVFLIKYLLKRFGLGFWSLQKDIGQLTKDVKSLAMTQIENESKLDESFKRVHESLSDVHSEFFKTAKALRDSTSFEASMSSEVGAIRADVLVIREEIAQIWSHVKAIPEPCLSGNCPYIQAEKPFKHKEL